MRIHSRGSMEGIVIYVYECNNCPAETLDNVLPPDWLEDEKNVHYCPDCIIELGD